MNNGLTSFRFFAFLGVFLYHERLCEFGYLGVHAFFVLSGFLLTPIILDMKKALPSKTFFSHFYGRRALRIFPLYFFYLLIISLLAFAILSQYENFARVEYFPDQLPWLLTYTYNFYHATDAFKHLNFVSHFWSLCIEEQFYLIWPLVLFLMPTKHVKRFLIAVIIAGPFIRALMAYLFSHDIITVYRGNISLAIYILPFSYLDAFSIGGFFALFSRSHNAKAVLVSLLAVVFIGLITDWIFVQEFTWQHLGYAAHMQQSYKYIWGYTLISLWVAYTLIHLRDKKFFPRIFEHSALVYLGTISYGLYVYHYIFVWIIDMLLSDWPRLYQAALCLPITIIVSHWSYQFVEKRFIDLKDKWFSRDKLNGHH